jgi:hypothetical protein
LGQPDQEIFIKPQIVHFSGHGTGEDGLVFEDIVGQEKVVDTEALTTLFKLFSVRVECVVLNACYSEIQAKAIVKHINYVIGMNQSIGDIAAIEFAVGFYTAVGAGEPIEFAYQLGCNAIQLKGIPEHLTPVLYKKDELSSLESNDPIKRKIDSIEVNGLAKVISTSASCTLTKINEQLHINLNINNESMVAGTNPRLEIEILSSHKGFYEFSGNYIAPLRASGSFRSLFQGISNLNLFRNALFNTNDVFLKSILYPKDRVNVFGVSSPFSLTESTGTIESVKLFIIHLQYLFLEIPRQEWFFLIDTNPSGFEGKQSCKVIMTCSGNETLAIAQMYLEASSSN